MNWEHILATRTARMDAMELRELLQLMEQPNITSFAGGTPDAALFPTQAFQDAYASILSSDASQAALQYSHSEGYLPLRDWIAGEMAKLDIPCGPENILITSGSQQALDYLGKLFLSPKDTALVGWPTYLGALAAFNAYEPEYDRLHPHENRSVADYMDSAAQKGGRVKMAYMSVDFANPTGVSLDRSQRDAMLDMADEMDIAVIEDAAYQSLRYDGEAVPPILALEIERKGSIENCRTVYTGSFSKTLSPGLRVGWICAATPLIKQLVFLKQASDLHSPNINQMVVADVAKTHFETHVKTIKATYMARRDFMLAALEKHMPDTVEWIKPEGGMFIWLTLPKDVDGSKLLATAVKAQQLAFVPGRSFFADGSGANTIRLSFCNSDADVIDDGIKRLASLL